MRPLSGYAAVLVAFALSAPVVASAQDSTQVRGHEVELLTDHTFNAAYGEPVRLFLVKGTTYRAEVHGRGLRLQLKPLHSTTQAPRLETVLPNRGESASGESLYTITPHADGEYAFTTVGGDAASPITLRVYAIEAANTRKH
jgi:hypothetical protein